jgi:hypothetical protein
MTTSRSTKTISQILSEFSTPTSTCTTTSMERANHHTQLVLKRANEPRYQTLFVPYSTMVPVKEKSNVRAYALGSKSSEDFAAEIDEDPEAFFSERWSFLPPHSKFPLISGEKISDNYLMCPRCDSVFEARCFCRTPQNMRCFPEQPQCCYTHGAKRGRLLCHL